MIDPLTGVNGADWAGPPGRIAAGFADGTSGFYDLTTRSRVKGIAVRAHGLVGTTQTSADGTRLYLAYVDGRIQTLDSRTGQQIGPTIQLDGAAVSVGVTADGSRVITTSLHNGQWLLTVHDTATGRQLGQLPDVNTAQIGPSDTLVAASIVGQVTQYGLHTLKPLGSFPDVRAFVSKLTFSKDGKTLMALSKDRSVSLYDSATRTRLGDPIPSKVPRRGASLRPDGDAVAVGDGNGIAIWDLNAQHLAAAACRLAGRNLTPAEWDTYLAALGPLRPTCPAHT
jgi:WD40 repeat protein